MKNRIMTEHGEYKLGFQLQRGVLLLAIGSLTLLPATMHAQAPAPAVLSFDVATIKPSDPNKPGGMMFFNDDKFETTGIELNRLIKFAYNLNSGGNQQIAGAPAWVSSAKFDIQAKEDADLVAALKKMPQEQHQEQMRLLVRGLLEDRFKLKVHHETRQLPVYAMTVAKGGVKMTPVPPPSTLPPAADAPPAPHRNSGLRMAGRGQIEGMNTNVTLLANVLGSMPELGDRMVIDQTGLTAKYDFMLKWTPDMAGAGADAGTPSDASGPSLFTALQEELGLRLEPTKAPVDTIVIDSVAMPSEN